MSGTLAGLILGIAVVCAWAITVFGRKAGESERKLRALRWAFLIGGVAFAAFAYFTDAEQRRTTLFEVVLKGLEGAVPATESAPPTHELTFVVEHPGVPHELALAPKPGFGKEATTAVSVHVELRGPEQVYVNEAQEFAMIRDPGSGRPARLPRKIWDSHSWSFTPDLEGTHTLRIAVRHVIPELLVRITDPKKTDGKRAPGY